MFNILNPTLQITWNSPEEREQFERISNGQYIIYAQKPLASYPSWTMQCVLDIETRCPWPYLDRGVEDKFSWLQRFEDDVVQKRFGQGDAEFNYSFNHVGKKLYKGSNISRLPTT